MAAKHERSARRSEGSPCYWPSGHHDSIDRADRQKATNRTTALIAWEYSHCRLRVSQFSGTVSQLSVAWFAGYVQTKNIASVRAMQRAAARASQKAHGCERTITASNPFKISAAGQSAPRIAQP